jgi:hypothetical protein
MTDTPPRFELQRARATLHMCDNCCKTDVDTAIYGTLGKMWTDNETGETLCNRCKIIKTLEREVNG